MTMAKGLSAGYQPISAVGLSDEVYQAIADLGDANGSFGHGFTYGGHPVATAVSLETLRIYQERDIVGHVQSVSPHFQQRLAGFLEHDMVGEVRGVGLLGAIDLVADKGRNKGFDPSLAVGNQVLAKAMSRGLLFRAAANTLLFCPPLIVSESDIDQIFDIVAEALGEVREDLRDR
jgi:4-aminobutyrate--pyruvate transaminase